MERHKLRPQSAVTDDLPIDAITFLDARKAASLLMIDMIQREIRSKTLARTVATQDRDHLRQLGVTDDDDVQIDRGSRLWRELTSQNVAKK